MKQVVVVTAGSLAHISCGVLDMAEYDSDKVAEIHRHLHSHLPTEPALRVKALESLGVTPAHRRSYAPVKKVLSIG